LAAPQSEGSSKERPPAVSTGLHSESSSLRQRILSPERTGVTAERPKKPGIIRRTSSIHNHPHKGQEFSVDDDQSEVAEDFAHRQASATSSTAVYGSLRRKTSTLRRRGAALASSLPRVDSADGNEDEDGYQSAATGAEGEGPEESGEEGTVQPGDGDDDDDALESQLSDTESFTLKDRQEAINETHPFGIRIWKPALYKKDRSVQKTAEGDIHSSPGGRVSNWLFLFNILWTVIFGWWLAAAAAIGAAVCFCFAFAPSAMVYGKVLFGLAGYLLYPFGQFVKLEQDEAYAEEDEGEGRSISEYEQWQSGDLEDGRLFFGPVTRSLVGRRRSSVDSASETDSLLGRGRGGHSSRSDSRAARNKRRLFGRGEWNIGRVIFFIFFYGLITPLLMFVSGICWLMVFWIPMGKITMLLFYHLRRHPLAMSFHSDTTYSRGPGTLSSSIVLCTYRAVGWKYYKYTIDGTNIFFINLIGVVFFVIFDYWILDLGLGMKNGLTHPAFIFALSLFSVIPLAYFIGQAVASISAQSSMGVGAAVNAFFSTVVEVFLYCVALKEGKGRLVEGSIIGSIMAGILLMPGLSMCFGAIKRKTQRFNAKSAGVTSTMLLFAVIAAFGPTLFYQIYGTVSFLLIPE
jgi:Ca2+:H+ antiporter